MCSFMSPEQRGDPTYHKRRIRHNAQISKAQSFRPHAGNSFASILHASKLAEDSRNHPLANCSWGDEKYHYEKVLSGSRDKFKPHSIFKPANSTKHENSTSFALPLMESQRDPLSLEVVRLSCLSRYTQRFLPRHFRHATTRDRTGPDRTNPHISTSVSSLHIPYESIVNSNFSTILIDELS